MKSRLAAVAVLPVAVWARRVREAFELAQRRRQHLGVEVAVDDPLPPAVLLEQARRDTVVAEAPAALPPRGGRDAARILAVDDLLQPRNDVRVTVLAQLHHDPAAAHLVGDGAGGAGAGEGIEDEVAGVGSDVDDSLEASRSGFGVSKALSFPNSA
jgi:hypothetical protein